MSTLITENLPILAAAPDGVPKLRGLIYSLAASGRLVNGEEDVEVRELGSLAEFVMGQAPPGIECNKSGDGYPFVKTGEFGPTVPEVREWTTKPLKFARNGDVLICVVGATVGKLNFGIDCAIGRSVAAIRPSHDLLTAYLYISLMPFTLRLREQSRGSAQGVIGKVELSGVPIRLPTAEEQLRIIAKVDELMALCDRLEAQQADAESAHAQLVATLLDSLTRASDSYDFAASWQRLSAHFHTLFTTESSIDALKKALLQLAVMGKLVPQDPSDEPASRLVERIKTKKIKLLEVTGGRKQKVLNGAAGEPPYEIPSSWEWQTVDSVLHVTGGVTLGRKLTGRRMSSKPYLRVANVQRGHLDLRQVKKVEVPEDEVEKYLLRDGDLLITEGGDWDKVGRTAIWRGELPECLHQNHVFRARAVTKEWESRWAEMYLNAAPAKKYFAASSKQTTNLASINMTQLRACAFPVPPLAEQHRIVAKFAQLMLLCGKARVAIQQHNQHSCRLADALVDKALSSAPETSTNVVDLSCYLVSRLATKPTFGRTAHMKLIYLADTHLELNLHGNYRREAAGPLDKSLYRVEEQAEANGWYTHTSAPLKSGKEKFTYHATNALAAKARKFADHLGGKRKELDRLISVLGGRSTEELEIVATLFAAWNDALLEGQSPNDDWIIREVRENWHIAKQRFSPDQLRYWLNWMREKRLVPTGTGRHTQHQTRLL